MLVAAIGLAVAPARLAAQDHDHSQMNQPPATTDWSWATDSNVIFGYNYQQRRFADFWAWESQNWLMVEAGRGVGRGRFTVDLMMSFEPWTIGRLVYADRTRLPPTGGSPQDFAALIAEQLQRWAPIVKSSGFQMD